MTREGFAEAAARIERNPLGRLMYGQRELFHSNLLGWFFDELPASADAAFQRLAPSGLGSPRRVERERQHMDVVMHWPGRVPLVIENKVFSIPGAAQLAEYEKATERWAEAPAFVLLSISPPDFEPRRWRYLSYSELAAVLRDSLEPVESYEVQTMRRYADLVEDLHHLVSAVEVTSPDERVWLDDEILAAVSSSQMHAALHKARASRVAQAINAAVSLSDPATAGMSRATPLVESLQYVQSSGLHLHLGWQLQGNQFRRAVVHHDPQIRGHSEESRRAREDVSRLHPEFFAFPSAITQVSSGRKEFNHFAPNFVYQYFKAPGLTVGELIAAAREIDAGVRGLSDAEAVARPVDAVRRTPGAALDLDLTS